MFGNQKKIIEVTLSAVILRADGSQEDKGILGYWYDPHYWAKKIRAKKNRKNNPNADVVTYAGLAIVTNTIVNSTLNPKYIGWGTGGTGATQGGTTLSTETYSTNNDGSHALRTTGTLSQVTQSQTNDTFKVVGTLTAASNAPTITNFGLFDTTGSSASPTTPPSGGNLYVWSSFTGIALSSGDGIQFTAQIKMT